MGGSVLDRLELSRSIALNRRACFIPAEDVQDRRPCRDRHCRTDVRCKGAQVSDGVFMSDSDAGDLRRGISSNFMRQQAMGSRMVFNRAIPVNRLVSSVADSKLLYIQSIARLTIPLCRGSGEHPGVWSKTLRCRLPCHRPRPIGPTSL